MNTCSKWLTALALLAGSMVAQTQAAPQPVLQRGYDANVSGANLTETTLNSSNIGPNTFGLLFTLPVDADSYAQPLYVPNLAMPGLGTHNVLYVATMNDSIYAFDADVGGSPLWSVNLASFFSTTPVLWANYNFPPIATAGNLGILSTPVIDPSTNIMYVVACTLENATMAYRLYAIDITTGSEPYGPGVLITGSYGGATFDARYLTQRVSLVLADNQVIVAFGAMQSEHLQPYTGWVMAYHKATLQQSGIFASEPGGNNAGIWQAGRPPAVDGAGHVYVFTGNAHNPNGYDGVNNFSESVLKLDPANGLTLLDWFTAGNWSYLDVHDADLTSSGPILIPGTTLLAGGGKNGYLYVVDTTNLGHWNLNDSQVVQKEKIVDGGEMLGGPVYWEGSTATGGPLLYNWGSGDVIKAYAFNGSTFATTPSAEGTSPAPIAGGILTLSANGNVPGSGVLWASVAGNPNLTPPVLSVLHAFNAENIANELWNSTMNPTRDEYRNAVRFMPPTVANGKVYLATAAGEVVVYGLLPTLSYSVSPTSLAFGNVPTGTDSAPQPVTVTNTGSAALPITSITLTGKNLSQFSQTNNCGASVAVGSPCKINVVFAPTSVLAKTATLNVNAGGGAGTQSVALTGTGVAPTPTFSVSPTSLAFGSVPTGTDSAPQSVTVTNTGSVALPIATIKLTGKNLSQFSQTNNCGTSVAVGTACKISVVFAPTSVLAKTATLSVTGGGGAGTQTVTLTGTGT